VIKQTDTEGRSSAVYGNLNNLSHDRGECNTMKRGKPEKIESYEVTTATTQDNTKPLNSICFISLRVLL